MSAAEPISPPAARPSFGRPLPIIVRWFLFSLCALLPTAYVITQYEVRHDLTQMIFFGQYFQPRALPEIRQLNVATNSLGGYDGQFYAQIGLDPALRRSDLPKAMDDPGVREQRIFLPFLAFLLGGGRPAAVLFAYALLNLIFWFVLFGSLIRIMRPQSGRDFSAFFAIMWTSGVLFSVVRALTDLPTAALGLTSLLLVEPAGAAMVAMALLTKPTGGLFLLRYAWPLPRAPGEWARKIALGLLAFLPLVFWQLYLWHTIPRATTMDPKAFSFPVVETFKSFFASWAQLTALPYECHWRDITHWEVNFFGFLGPISMTVQGAFLLLRPRWRDSIWIMGAPFAVLFLSLSQEMVVGDLGYARTVIPLTIAFNFFLRQVRSTPLFWLLLVFGNIGLLGMVHDTMSFIWRSCGG